MKYFSLLFISLVSLAAPVRPELRHHLELAQVENSAATPVHEFAYKTLAHKIRIYQLMKHTRQMYPELFTGVTEDMIMDVASIHDTPKLMRQFLGPLADIEGVDIRDNPSHPGHKTIRGINTTENKLRETLLRRFLSTPGLITKLKLLELLADLLDRAYAEGTEKEFGGSMMLASAFLKKIKIFDKFASIASEEKILSICEFFEDNKGREYYRVTARTQIETLRDKIAEHYTTPPELTAMVYVTERDLLSSHRVKKAYTTWFSQTMSKVLPPSQEARLDIAQCLIHTFTPRLILKSRN